MKKIFEIIKASASIFFIGLNLNANGQSKPAPKTAPINQIKSDSIKQNTDEKKLFYGCSLSSPEQIERAEKLKKEILKKILTIKELSDGYEIIFDEKPEFANDLLEYINFERVCCQYYTFALLFEPNLGNIHLQMRGSEEIKAELKLILEK